MSFNFFKKWFTPSQKANTLTELQSLSEKLNLSLYIPEYEEIDFRFIDKGYFNYLGSVSDQSINKLIGSKDDFDMEMDESDCGFSNLREMAEGFLAECVCYSTTSITPETTQKEKLQAAQSLMTTLKSVIESQKDLQIDGLYIIRPHFQDGELDEWFQKYVATTKRFNRLVEELYV